MEEQVSLLFESAVACRQRCIRAEALTWYVTYCHCLSMEILTPAEDLQFSFNLVLFI